MIVHEELETYLFDKFGLSFTVRPTLKRETPAFLIEPSGIPRTLGFSVEVELGWRSLEFNFLPSSYSKNLMSGIKMTLNRQIKVVTSFFDLISKRGGKLQLLLDGKLTDPSALSERNDAWHVLNLRMEKIGVINSPENSENFKDDVLEWTGLFFAALVSILPIEPVLIGESPDPEVVGEKEGGSRFRQVKVYERSRLNRMACIEIHGSSCKACGLDFEARYGEIGKGFIHVHHIVPISKMDESYVLDPSKDLVPLCPNCHAMVHRNNPPFSYQYIAKLLEKSPFK